MKWRSTKENHHKPKAMRTIRDVTVKAKYKIPLRLPVAKYAKMENRKRKGNTDIINFFIRLLVVK